jgi:hypothetical protein
MESQKLPKLLDFSPVDLVLMSKALISSSTVVPASLA